MTLWAASYIWAVLRTSDWRLRTRIGESAGFHFQYLGGAVEDNSQLSPETRQVIDAEVQRLVTEQYERAQALLKSHLAALATLAQQLLKRETVSGNDVKAALENAASPGSPADAAQLSAHAKA